MRIILMALVPAVAWPLLAAETPAPAGAPYVKVLTRTTMTMTGQPLQAPTGPIEATISIVELPVGGVLPPHKHPWPRFAYVEQGRLRVRYQDSGQEREFVAGDAVAEAVNQWHEGQVVGDQPVRLIVFDQTPPGASNVVRQ